MTVLEGDVREPVIALLQNADGDEEIPKNVAGILLAHELPHLSHLAVRARQAGVVFVACEESNEFEQLEGLAGQFLAVSATPDKLAWKKIDRVEAPKQPVHSSHAKLPPTRLTQEARCVSLEEATPENSGGKTAGMRLLAQLSRDAKAGFATPSALVIPFGVMEVALRATPAIQAEYSKAIEQLDKTPPAQIGAATSRLRGLVQQLPVHEQISSEVQRTFHSPLIVRSSANAEDAEDFSGAGLYESVPNVPPSDVANAIRKVWSSLWTERATLSRRNGRIPHDQTHMAVLIQELLHPDFAFVLHTTNPVTSDPAALYGEIVVGLGETLVSAAAAGNPYRFSCNKQSGTVELLAFANFSKAVAAGVSPVVKPGAPPGAPRPKKSYTGGNRLSPGRMPPSTSGEAPDATLLAATNSPSPLRQGEGRGEGLISDVIDYSRITLSLDPAALESLARRLCNIGAFVEQALGKPQDIEGVVIQDKVYLVQTRPQQGL
jgi:phosphoglucan,water dikinase